MEKNHTQQPKIYPFPPPEKNLLINLLFSNFNNFHLITHYNRTITVVSILYHFQALCAHVCDANFD